MKYFLIISILIFGLFNNSYSQFDVVTNLKVDTLLTYYDGTLDDVFYTHYDWTTNIYGKSRGQPPSNWEVDAGIIYTIPKGKGRFTLRTWVGAFVYKIYQEGEQRHPLYPTFESDSFKLTIYEGQAGEPGEKILFGPYVGRVQPVMGYFHVKGEVEFPEEDSVIFDEGSSFWIVIDAFGRNDNTPALVAESREGNINRVSRWRASGRSYKYQEMVGTGQQPEPGWIPLNSSDLYRGLDFICWLGADFKTTPVEKKSWGEVKTENK